MSNFNAQDLDKQQLSIINMMMNTGTGGFEKNKSPRLATYLSEPQIMRLVEGMSEKETLDFSKKHTNPEKFYIDKNGNKRYWLKDDDAKLKMNGNKLAFDDVKDDPETFKEYSKLKDVLNHPLLMKAVPTLQNSFIKKMNPNNDKLEGLQQSASISINDKGIKRNAERKNQNPIKRLLNKIMHETQHVVQNSAKVDGDYDMDFGNEYSNQLHEKEAREVERLLMK